MIVYTITLNIFSTLALQGHNVNELYSEAVNEIYTNYSHLFINYNKLVYTCY